MITKSELAEIWDWPKEWWAFVTLEEASKVSTLSIDTLERNHPDKIINLSRRRKGMRLGHALNLNCK
jgi:hypothetical protein